MLVCSCARMLVCSCARVLECSCAQLFIIHYYVPGLRPNAHKTFGFVSDWRQETGDRSGSKLNVRRSNLLATAWRYICSKGIPPNVYFILFFKLVLFHHL